MGHKGFHTSRPSPPIRPTKGVWAFWMGVMDGVMVPTHINIYKYISMYIHLQNQEQGGEKNPVPSPNVGKRRPARVRAGIFLAEDS